MLALIGGHAKGIDIAKGRGFYYVMNVEKEGVLCNKKYMRLSLSYFLLVQVSLPGNNNDP